MSPPAEDTHYAYQDDLDPSIHGGYDWDPGWSDDDDEPRRDPRERAGPGVVPVITFERVRTPAGETIDASIDAGRFRYGSGQEDRATLRELTRVLTGVHGDALIAPTLIEAFARLRPLSQKQLAEDLEVGETAFSRRYSQLFVALPCAVVPMQFLFAADPRFPEIRRRTSASAAALAQLPNASTKKERSAQIDLAIRIAEGLPGPALTGDVRDKFRKDLAALRLLLFDHADVVAEYRSVWPRCDIDGMLTAIGHRKRTVGDTAAWAVLCSGVGSRR